MDQYATIDGSVEWVFARLADPARLEDWLPAVVRVDLDPNVPVEAGSVFTLTGLDHRAAAGEVVSYEPPRLVSYRIFLPQPRVLRLICVAERDDRVRVHLYQTDSPTPITADLPRLGLIGNAAGEPPARGHDRPGRRSSGGTPPTGDSTCCPGAGGPLPAGAEVAHEPS